MRQVSKSVQRKQKLVAGRREPVDDYIELKLVIGFGLPTKKTMKSKATIAIMSMTEKPLTMVRHSLPAHYPQLTSITQSPMIRL